MGNRIQTNTSTNHSNLENCDVTLNSHTKLIPRIETGSPPQQGNGSADRQMEGSGYGAEWGMGGQAMELRTTPHAECVEHGSGEERRLKIPPAL